MKKGYIYIVTNQRNGTIYIEVTSNLIKRIYQHKNHIIDGFTKKYDATILVYYEICDSMYSAISREKELKGWNRKWKLDLIEEHNPQWHDLYDEIRGIEN